MKRTTMSIRVDDLTHTKLKEYAKLKRISMSRAAYAMIKDFLTKYYAELKTAKLDYERDDWEKLYKDIKDRFSRYHSKVSPVMRKHNAQTVTYNKMYEFFKKRHPGEMEEFLDTL